MKIKFGFNGFGGVMNVWTVPVITLPLNLSLVITFDREYITNYSIDVLEKRNEIELQVATALQEKYTGADIAYYNSQIIDLIHTDRPYIKSVEVSVTDSSTIPVALNNGIEIKSDDNDILAGLPTKFDIVKYIPPHWHWDLNNIDITTFVI